MYQLGLILFIIFSLLPLVYFIYIIYLQLIPGAFYYPSTPKDVSLMLKLAKAKPTNTLIDLGSGDGRIVIAAAQMGIKSIGYELNPLLVKKSRRLIKKLNLSHLAQIEYKNFWKIDFNQADIITLYQLPKYLNKIQKKIEKEIKHPVTVISNDYPFAHKNPIITKNKVFVYRFH